MLNNLVQTEILIRHIHEIKYAILTIYMKIINLSYVLNTRYPKTGNMPYRKPKSKSRSGIRRIQEVEYAVSTTWT